MNNRSTSFYLYGSFLNLLRAKGTGHTLDMRQDIRLHIDIQKTSNIHDSLFNIDILKHVSED